ncbi:hypothetical protein CspeluHIS016_0203110 [Cutaneotrichosporon spelunceum]|uniref:RecA family profile 1 domain-containing protein n=1 Tax=Cutaneotrichosporon spelunceum TaxID=1672016 RepID=A0AAD3TRU1_9TREE|nr:hypothetical protein CspeluHIS016_0203110 [Cutaneotrichosporon spelunceum]
MSAATSHLSLPHFIKLALVENGYLNVADLEGATPTDLAAELAISLPQAEDVLRQAASLSSVPSRPSSRPPSPSRAQTAADLLHAVPGPRFSTLSGAIDGLLAHYSPLHVAPQPLNLKGKGRALGGAVVPGMVLEISGPPGSGKSAVALSTALSGAVGGFEALIIDTEGAMVAQRIKAAAGAFLDSLPDSGGRSVDEILERIHVMRVATQVQMVAVLHTLGGWLESHPAVKLVVIDTLSYHFRQPSLELTPRKRIMELIKLSVGKAATVRGCAVLATSQMATKLLTAENKRATFETGDRAVLMPSLGDLWTTERTVRVALFRGRAGDDLRYAHASTTSTPGNSHRSDPPWASFDIDTAGLPCDMPPAPMGDNA